MFAGISDCLKSMPRWKRWLTLCVVLAGIISPWLLSILLIATHGSFSNVFDFSPLLYAFAALAALSILVLVIAAIELWVPSLRGRGPSRYPFIVTQVVAAISIVVTLAGSGYVLLPQLVRSGDTPPQLMLTQGQMGVPGIALAFWTREETTNTLEWGPGGGTLQTVKEQQVSHHHWFQLDGIEPGRPYQYSLNGKKAAEFRAPPATDKPLRFAASGDPHFGNPLSNNVITARMLDYIKDPANNYAMLFILGDTAHMGFDDNLWKKALGTLSSCTSSIPACYIIGNHDTMFGGLNFYQDYLCQPQGKDEKGRCLWKRIDSGNVHFLILDVEWDATLYTPEQKAWLVEQLESIPSDDWCIIMSHTFYYCSGAYNYGWGWYDNSATIEKLTPLFEKYGVDLVLSGHKHHSELLQKNGVTYVVMGSFGGPPDPEREYISPASVWYRSGVYGFIDVTVDGDTANVVLHDHENMELYRKVITRNNAGK